MTAPVRILAVADSDSNLKWAAATLERLGTGPERSIAVLRSPIAPSAAQTRAALAGTDLAAPPVVGLRGLRSCLRRTSPDAVIVAATGATAELIGCLAVRHVERRPVLVAGLPGIAVAGIERMAAWRRWVDAFIVHGRREADDVAAAFAQVGASPRIVLDRLPFLGDPYHLAAPVRRVVFAAQAKVPEGRDERVAILEGLARLAGTGLEVVVKLRAAAGERQTHNEAFPYDVLWKREHTVLGFPESAIRFVEGRMRDWLDPDSALVTVSSTAAIEALALGLPTVLINDFGIREALLNEPFAHSGCLVRLADVPELLRAGGPVPDPAWLDRNYLHTDPPELVGALAELVDQRRAGALSELPDIRPRDRAAHLRAVLRTGTPSWLHCRGGGRG